MRGLADLAIERNIHIQTHISENVKEVALVKKMYNMGYADVYDSVGILTSKVKPVYKPVINAKCVFILYIDGLDSQTILAHGVHLTDDELKLLQKRGTSIAHCPTSNTCLKSGLCDVRRILEFGVQVGLGTDVAGGCKSSILCTINDVLNVSTSVSIVKHQIGEFIAKNPDTLDTSYVPINYKEALYLATLGGAEALRVDKVVGNFVEGKEFDALIVDVGVGALDVYNIPEIEAKKSAEKKLLELVQRFVYVGDDRNVQNVFVQGRKVKG